MGVYNSQELGDREVRFQPNLKDGKDLLFQILELHSF